ncbi:glycerol kinase GlpK [Marinomonas mediterranea]|uniref:Glycerol kinase n=1 Tax=Marinomonas mediterranea (strain ATCC 700492 / JCM 21426 / NBRC 103028 / MMB-1) TaxID=717774 RepID=F2K0F7_MARM1|nr:glycerol kinase GlpK [Marinomonas mediterranea]ADZ89872.1 Glycerol kinase [Marinomonas mediterranea MMB-1]WCN07957.1 glycerol kinase GlpK [Marinomonas mediterranea]WCN12052.1 glycerol kinase GlpK [Marinomonas mediterranea]WCN16090.1 glycerol kinase GlpK [Marinomonas mediterranea MMB-1]
MTDYLLAIDQGTTSSRAILFNRTGDRVVQAQEEFPQHFPNDGWVEHDPTDLWDSTLSVCRKVLDKAGVMASQVASIGITNQRETTLLWNIETGEPVYNAIVWQDRRTADYCKALEDKGFADIVHSKTGLLIDSYFSATKIRWVLQHSLLAQQLAAEGKLAFGTVDSYLIWCLTDGEVHKTDATNAARTMVFNIHDQCWDSELIQLFGIENIIFPQVMDSSDDFGLVNDRWLGAPIPINGVAGDQQAALVGQACFKPGMVKSTYGTGCFLILNTGDRPVVSKHKLLTTIGYRINGKVSYALEGSIFVAGATMQWLRDGLKLFEDASETKSLAEQSNYDNVYLVPAFTGLGAPYWDPDARGAIVGLTRDTGISDIVSAGLRSVCYQTKDLVDAMAKDGAEFNSLRIDGGMAVNDYMAQFLSDILEISVERPKITETTALGVAYLAALRIGWFNSLDDVTNLWLADRAFSPLMPAEKSQTLYSGWLDSVERVRTSD